MFPNVTNCRSLLKYLWVREQLISSVFQNPRFADNGDIGSCDTSLTMSAELAQTGETEAWPRDLRVNICCSGEGGTETPPATNTHIQDNSVMSNNINILNRVNHLGNVSISNQSSATFSSVSCHLAMTESAAHWEINECWAAVDLQSLIWAVTGPDGSRGLPSHLSGGRQSESGHHPVISQPGRGWERPPLWPPLYLVRICDIQLLFRPTSVRSSWCMCKNCLQWKIGE